MIYLSISPLTKILANKMKFDNQTISKPTNLFNFLLQKRKEKQFQQTLEVSLTFFFICFFLLLAIRPTVVTISKLVGEIEAKKEMVNTGKKQINQIIQAQNVFSQVQSNYQIIDQSLPSTYAFSNAANQIMGITQQVGLNTNSISFDLDSKKNNQAKSVTSFYGYSLSSPLDFFSLTDLLSQINNNRRLLEIDSLTIQAQPPATDQTNPTLSASPANPIVVKLNTKIYYLPNE